MFHWANIYDDEIATVAYEEWKNGDRRHMEWAVAIYEGDMIVNVFALQTSAQHAVTGSFADWRQ